MRYGIFEFQLPVNTETGEEVTLEDFLEYFLQEYQRDKHGWEMGYPRELAGMLRLIPGAGSQILAYVLTKKRRDNKLEQTNQEIADELKISLKSVAKTMQQFEKAGYLRRGRRGIRMVNPDVMSWGTPVYAGNKKAWENLS